MDPGEINAEGDVTKHTEPKRIYQTIARTKTLELQGRTVSERDDENSRTEEFEKRGLESMLGKGEEKES